VLKYYLEDLGVVLIFLNNLYLCDFQSFVVFGRRDWIMGFLWQTELQNPQNGQIIVMAAHFRPAESSTCFKTIKQVSIVLSYVSYINKLREWSLFMGRNLVNGENKV
jgi:hypothetical protein